MPHKPTGGRPPSVLGGDKGGGGGRPPARPGGNPENRAPSTGSKGPKPNVER